MLDRAKNFTLFVQWKILVFFFLLVFLVLVVMNYGFTDWLFIENGVRTS